MENDEKSCFLNKAREEVNAVGIFLDRKLSVQVSLHVRYLTPFRSKWQRRIDRV